MHDIPKFMKGVQLCGHGGPDKLVYREDIPVPVPRANEVLIKVGAAGINNTDINTRIGWYSKASDSGDTGWSGKPLQFPRIQGADVCGRVIAAGNNVHSDIVGKRVLVEPCLFEAGGLTLNPPWYFGSECDGGFAEYTVVAQQHAHPIICDLSDVELASFPCSYSTAENLLTRAQVSAKERVLVTGASGGVGSAVIQLAKARGATIIAVTSPSKFDQIIALGAERVLPREADFSKALGENSIDVVIDLVGGKQWSVLLDVLRTFGRYATAGAIAGADVELDLRTLYLKDLTFYGCTVLSKSVFPTLVKRIERGDVAPLVSKTFAMTDMTEAQKQFETKQHIGKLVIEI